jgi:hypothetical protein
MKQYQIHPFEEYTVSIYKKNEKDDCYIFSLVRAPKPLHFSIHSPGTFLHLFNNNIPAATKKKTEKGTPEQILLKHINTVHYVVIVIVRLKQMGGSSTLPNPRE